MKHRMFLGVHIYFLPMVCLGSSETEVFDEKSPSGNDYLAEVNEMFSLRILVFVMDESSSGLHKKNTQNFLQFV